MQHDNANGLCECGCGTKTTLWPQSYTKLGVKKGQPRRYVAGHQSRKSDKKMATCHTDRIVKAKGLCASCYNADLVNRTPEAKLRYQERCRASWAKNYASRNSDEHASRQKNRALRHRYGISLVEYHNMHIAQDNRCSICNAIGGDTRATRLYVDHNHKTGKVRNLLCPKCNHDVGTVEQGIGRIAELAAYLAEHSPEEEWERLAEMKETT